jgi:hypothetical protein
MPRSKPKYTVNSFCLLLPIGKDPTINSLVHSRCNTWRMTHGWMERAMAGSSWSPAGFCDLVVSPSLE